LCMKKTYKQLTADERDEIAIFMARGFNSSNIARMLGRDRSTISREIRRNGAAKYKRYTPHAAEARSKLRKSAANTHPRLKNLFIRDYVHQKIKDGWTPEIIAGTLKKEHPENSISHEAIYQYIYADALELKKHLPRHYRVRRKRKAKKTGSVENIPGRVGIDLRPENINDRSEFGHWESDSMVSRQSHVTLVVQLERVSRYVKIIKVLANKSEPVSRAIIQNLTDIDTSFRKSITYDNGKENVKHQDVNQALGISSYFCNAYRSWEKGSIEQIIGLIRRYLPKKTDFAKVPESQIKYIENQLNSRPRKCLNFATPYDVLLTASVALHG
jgi:IS30 family transposase